MTNRINGRTINQVPPIPNPQLPTIKETCNICFDEVGGLTFNGIRVSKETDKEIWLERLQFPIGINCIGKYENCVECGITYRQEVLSETVTGRNVCPHCISDYCQCVCCEKHDKTSRINRYQNLNGEMELWCSSCYNEYFIECPLCGNHHPSGTFCEIEYNDDDLNICEECQTNVRTCSLCDENYMSWQESQTADGDYCCEPCALNDREQNRFVHGYSFRPRDFIKRFMPDEDKRLTPTYGVELEFESGESYEEVAEIAKSMIEQFDPNKRLFFFKEDGSLSEGGLELVTHPWSKRFHVETDIWAGVLESLRKDHHCVSYNNGNCGIHIHRSRTDLTKIAQTKLGLFIHEQQEFIETIAQRNSRGYSKFFNKGEYSRKDVGSSPKYTAINFSTGRKTIELRVYKGSLILGTMKGYIEFYDALCSYVKIASVVDVCKPDGYKMFVGFVKRFRRTYPYLYKYLIRRKVCEPKTYNPKAKNRPWIRTNPAEV